MKCINRIPACDDMSQYLFLTANPPAAVCTEAVKN